MVERFLAIKDAVIFLQQKGTIDEAKRISDSEWDILADICFLLYPFKLAQKWLEGEKYVTSSLVVLSLCELKSRLEFIASFDVATGDYATLQEMNGTEDIINDDVLDCARAMLDNLEERFGHLDKPFKAVDIRGRKNRFVGVPRGFVIAHVLDPRTKDLGSIQDAGNKEELIQHVVKLMVDEERDNPIASWASANAATSPNSASTGPAASAAPAAASLGLFTDYDARADMLLEEAAQSVSDGCKQELDLYLKAPRLPLIGSDGRLSDPLSWWHDRCNYFPRVWNLAQIYLAIPATSAPSERIFSKAGNAISDKRCSLNDKTARDLVFMQHNQCYWEP